MKTHFESAPVRIGKHDWRVVVKSGWPGCEPWRRLTEYQWRRVEKLRGSEFESLGPWRPETEWPTYNADDGTYAGCPKSLGDKVFVANQTAIKNAIEAAGHNEFPLERV
jgi:hypothetical protein